MKGTQVLRALSAGSMSQKANTQGGGLLLPLENKMCLSLRERKKGRKWMTNGETLKHRESDVEGSLRKAGGEIIE